MVSTTDLASFSESQELSRSSIRDFNYQALILQLDRTLAHLEAANSPPYTEAPLDATAEIGVAVPANDEGAEEGDLEAEIEK
ncbi:hypothetical protein NMY22_g5261 [Coprinellus aureogranulatus]|nr:hypothetical protein NMY22_g5261 [Coprinellus aureogranulatus]